MIKKEPAVYKYQNERTEECYVGGTKNAQGRKRQHEYDLRLKKHRNPKLQTDFLNGDTFQFIILEYLPSNFTDDEIVRREQEWISFLKPIYNSRNAIPIYGSDVEMSRARKMAGKRTSPQTEEEKRKRADSVRKYWATHTRRKLSQEEKETISRRLRENPPRKGAVLSEELKKRISDSVSKYIYVFISPNGEEIKARSVKRFANENGLSENWMYALVNGHREQNSGWRFKEKIPNT